VVHRLELPIRAVQVGSTERGFAVTDRSGTGDVFVGDPTISFFERRSK
jgi:hypothetical protein